MPNWKEDEVLTTEQATQYLKISKPTLFKHLHSGEIKGIKVGRSWRFLQSELYRFLGGDSEK